MVRAILNEEIAERANFWHDDPLGETEVRALLADRAAHHVALVAEVEGAVAGYASYATFRGERSGYARSVEHSVYVSPAAQGMGLGRRLLQALIEHARARGKHMMVGGMDADNTASIALHASEGFVETARMPEVGYKFGRWLTLVFMQKTL